MEMSDKAYEIKITPIISYETFNRVRKVEAIQTKTVTFFRYVSLTLYRDYDVITDEKFFLKEEEAIAYWNEAISTQYAVIPSRQCLAVTA